MGQVATLREPEHALCRRSGIRLLKLLHGGRANELEA